MGIKRGVFLSYNERGRGSNLLPKKGMTLKNTDDASLVFSLSDF